MNRHEPRTPGRRPDGALVYLDANASEPMRPQATDAAIAAMALAGNPSSVHAAGRQARRLLEDARATIAARFGAAPAQLVFTSGGTEANGLALAAFGAGRTVLVGATEHDSVRAASPASQCLPVGEDGRVLLGPLEVALRRGPALVALMLANNETGVLHPIAEVAALCRRHGALLHVDAVQAAGRLDVSLADTGADSLAISGHKFGGMKGAGALILAPGLSVAPLLAGGGQERGRRGGTQALPAIAAMAAALDATSSARAADLAALRDRLERAATASGAVVCGGGAKLSAARLPNTSCLARPGVRADLQVMVLDLTGIAVSAGAACSSGKVARSHVLDAMGLEALAGCAIRVSLAWNATAGDVDRFIAAYTDPAFGRALVGLGKVAEPA